jgi:hypothetical protein
LQSAVRITERVPTWLRIAPAAFDFESVAFVGAARFMDDVPFASVVTPRMPPGRHTTAWRKPIQTAEDCRRTAAFRKSPVGGRGHGVADPILSFCRIGA